MRRYLLKMKRLSPSSTDGPSPADGRPPVHRVDANYIHSEPDPWKGGAPLTASLEKMELRNVAQLRSTAQPQNVSSGGVCSDLSIHPEDVVLGQLSDVPGLVHDRRFREGARRLLAEGKTPAELARAVRAAAGDPSERGGLSFIADRFERWARKARERERKPATDPVLDRSARMGRERRDAEDRARILAEQESAEGRALVEACAAALPWRR